MFSKQTYPKKKFKKNYDTKQKKKALWHAQSACDDASFDIYSIS